MWYPYSKKRLTMYNLAKAAETKAPPLGNLYQTYIFKQTILSPYFSSTQVYSNIKTSILVCFQETYSDYNFPLCKTVLPFFFQHNIKIFLILEQFRAKILLYSVFLEKKHEFIPTLVCSMVESLFPIKIKKIKKGVKNKFQDQILPERMN